MKLDDIDSVKNILSWLPDSQLARLAFSPVLPENERSGLRSLTVPLAVTNNTTTIQQDWLQQIVFSNAWRIDECFIDYFSDHWRHKFRVTDLVLATAPISMSGCEKGHSCYSSRHDLEHTLFGCSKNPNRWGSYIERIRLEESWAAHGYILGPEDLPNHVSLKNLRILILSPNNVCKEYDRMPPATYHEAIAMKMIETAPSSLRYISICQDAF